jgi:hypothetical protein
MSNSIFDLEQQIQDCWKVTDDIDLITKHLVEDLDINGQTADAMVNKYSAIKELYDVKFNQVWKTFEKVCAEYHGKGE